MLFSAHYDHIGIRAASAGDSIANGANDDASGTTAVVMLGRYFAERGTPERTLLFAAFTAEELGGYGSRYYSTQLDPDQIVAMFNIEMIGKPAVEGPNTAWITGLERSSFGLLLQEAVTGTEYEFYPDPYPAQGLFYRSDNATLARLGVPAHSISNNAHRRGSGLSPGNRPRGDPGPGALDQHDPRHRDRSRIHGLGRGHADASGSRRREMTRA